MNFTEHEKMQLRIIDSNLKCLNGRHPLDAITIRTYVADGNRVDLLVGTRTIVLGLTIEQAYYAVIGICAYDCYFEED